MGSCTIQTAGIGKTASEVFQAKVKQAEYEYGIDPYSGTIATVDGFKMVKLPARANIQKFVDGRFDVMDKRACECFELSKSRASKFKAQHGMKGKRGKVFFFYGWAAE